jgi:hypothetical protein
VANRDDGGHDEAPEQDQDNCTEQEDSRDRQVSAAS